MNGSQSHRSVKSQQVPSQMDIQTHRSNPIHLGFSSLLYLSTLVGERDGEYNTHRLFFGIFYIFLVSLCNPFFKFYITFAFLNYTENSSVNFQFRICIHLNLELNLELIVTICQAIQILKRQTKSKSGFLLFPCLALAVRSTAESRSQEPSARVQ